MNFLWHGRVSFFFLDTTVLTLEGQQQQSSPSFKFFGVEYGSSTRLLLP